METMTVFGLLLASLVISMVDSVQVVSRRDLPQDAAREIRAENYSFFKDFGKTKVGGFYDKDDGSGGFKASHKFDNGKIDGDIGWDSDGHFKGGVKGDYSWNNGKTQLGGQLDFDDDGHPKGQFSFSHNF